MERPSNPIVETREEFMISPTNEENPCLRTAHFIKPSANSLKGPVFNIPSHGGLSLNPKICDTNVNFSGWTFPEEKWKKWVDKMEPLHSTIWKKAGIFEAIMSSKYKIFRHCDLVYKLVEKWCPETSSFIFSWGEATITLEDVLAFGFSVLGSPVYSPLRNEELKAIEERLNNARLKMQRTSSQQARTSLWLKEFMNSESDIEHEAFLAMWLSRYVLTDNRRLIRKLVFPVAIHSARGTRIALGPAVLASIYRDLRLLKERFVKRTDSGGNQMNFDVSKVWIKSPFHLVQVWAWERFVELRPPPHLLKNGEPRLARWNKLKMKTGKVSLVLDSGKASFKWRPYVETVENWKLPMIYGEKSTWVRMDSGVHEEVMLLVKCLRASLLIGLKCKENYYPQRVAMQFGFDQDLPGFPNQYDINKIDEIVWQHYDRPVDGLKLYIPSKSAEGQVTTCYMEWWKQLVLKRQDSMKNVGQQQRIFMPHETETKVTKQRTSNKKAASSLKIKPKISKGRRARDYLGRFKRALKSNKQTLQSASITCIGTIEADEYISLQKSPARKKRIVHSHNRRGVNHIPGFNVMAKCSMGMREGFVTFIRSNSPTKQSESSQENLTLMENSNEGSKALATSPRQPTTSVKCLTACELKQEKVRPGLKTEIKEVDEYASYPGPSNPAKEYDLPLSLLKEINICPVPPGFPPTAIWPK